MLNLNASEKKELKNASDEIVETHRVQINQILKEDFMTADSMKISNRFTFCYKYLSRLRNRIGTELKIKIEKYLASLTFFENLMNEVCRYEDAGFYTRVAIKNDIVKIVNKNRNEMLSLIDFFIDELDIISDKDIPTTNDVDSFEDEMKDEVNGENRQ